MLENGWIKIHRKITEWEWYDDINTKVVFFHLLLTCNYEDKKWHGMVIKRGERVISLSKLAKECRLSVRNIRTCIKRLKSTQEVTSKRHGSFTLIKVNNYDSYQTSDTLSDKEVTRRRQGSDNNERKIKKEKKERNIYIDQNSKNFMQKEDFEQFWDAYPRKINKKTAQRKFLMLSRTLKEVIMQAIVKHKDSKQWRDGFIPHPTTWLNGERWNDEVVNYVKEIRMMPK